MPARVYRSPSRPTRRSVDHRLVSRLRSRPLPAFPDEVRQRMLRQRPPSCSCARRGVPRLVLRAPRLDVGGARIERQSAVQDDLLQEQRNGIRRVHPDLPQYAARRLQELRADGEGDGCGLAHGLGLHCQRSRLRGKRLAALHVSFIREGGVQWSQQRQRSAGPADRSRDRSAPGALPFSSPGKEGAERR